MRDRLRVAIVGCGGISAAHMRGGFAQLADRFDVVACCDVEAARAGAFAAAHGIARHGTRYEDVLASNDIDVVDICTPPMLHGDMVEAALRAGKHAICEKPFTSSLARLDAIAALERVSHARAMPIFQYRFGNGVARVRHAIRSGLAGRAFVSAVETMWLRQADYYAVPWRGKFATELGGVLLTQAIHMHDLLFWLIGPPACVSAFRATRVNPIEVEDCAAVALRMADGSLATLTCTLGSVREITRFRLVFEHAVFECEAEGRAVSAPGDAHWRVDARTPEVAAAITQCMDEVPPAPRGFAGQFAAFHDAIGSGAPFPVTLDDARQSLELITAAYHADATGEAVMLPIGGDHPRYGGWVRTGYV